MGQRKDTPQSWLDERFNPPPATGKRLSHTEGIPGAETKAAFADRVFAAMEIILASAEEHQVIVTHGFAHLHHRRLDTNAPSIAGYVNFRSKPGSITTLHQDDYFHNRQVAVLADTHHLDQTHPDGPSAALDNRDRI